jgi:hypothetical protein
MKSSFLRSATITLAAILSLSACGGAGSNPNEPAGAVNAAMDAAESGGLAKVPDYTCAAKKNDVSSLFGGGDLSSLAALGVDSSAMLDAVKMDFQDVKTTETSKSGDKATVHVTGKAVITFDQAKMKVILKQVMTNSGQPADDATINTALTAMAGAMSQSQDLDEDVSVVQEGGKWLICQ